MLAIGERHGSRRLPTMMMVMVRQRRRCKFAAWKHRRGFGRHQRIGGKSQAAWFMDAKWRRRLSSPRGRLLPAGRDGPWQDEASPMMLPRAGLFPKITELGYWRFGSGWLSGRNRG